MANRRVSLEPPKARDSHHFEGLEHSPVQLAGGVMRPRLGQTGGCQIKALKGEIESMSPEQRRTIQVTHQYYTTATKDVSPFRRGVDNHPFFVPRRADITKTFPRQLGGENAGHIHTYKKSGFITSTGRSLRPNTGSGVSQLPRTRTQTYVVS